MFIQQHSVTPLLAAPEQLLLEQLGAKATRDVTNHCTVYFSYSDLFTHYNEVAHYSPSLKVNIFSSLKSRVLMMYTHRSNWCGRRANR